jgi:5-methylcytosine-specific restriction endonuclease McrA
MTSFYMSKEWHRTRYLVLERDGFICTVPHCHAEATIVDHIVSRNAGGSDEPSNLRSLCPLHDNQVKEQQRGGRRARGGQFVVQCDVNGMPRDPNHPWYRKRT